MKTEIKLLEAAIVVNTHEILSFQCHFTKML